MKYNYKNLFASQHEKFIAILGQDYFSSLLVDDDLSDSAIIISDRRVYQVGKLYEYGRRIHGGGLRVSRGKKTVSLQDVTGTMSKEVTQPLPGSSLVVFGIIAATLGLLSGVKQSTIIMVVIAAVSVAAGIFLIMRLRKRYLVIEYAGGSMAQPVKFITDTELNLFQGIIMVEKERVMSGAGDLKECPNCGEKIQITAKICRFCGEQQNEPAAD
ncbi:MAG: zinc ribbon domain-containing protein [Bacteroidales bacterium]|nr:zinc ribbon domain-containing protein [Bacteroidales bacterium]